MTIEICNLRNEKPRYVYDIRVDRTSPLGNPFYMHNESERDIVCDKYEKRFKKIISNWIEGEVVITNRNMFNEIWKLILLYKEHGKLRLFCWCAPKHCHAETIKIYLLSVKKE